MSNQWTRRFDELEPGDTIELFHQHVVVVAVLGRPGVDGWWEVAVNPDPTNPRFTDSTICWPSNKFVQAYDIQPIQKGHPTEPCVLPARHSPAGGPYSGLPVFIRKEPGDIVQQESIH